MSKYKFTKVLTPEQIGFLEYFMLPEGDEFQYVYRPGDDSFLLLSVLKQQMVHFPTHPTICEVGSGSGILSAHLNNWLRQNKNEPSFHFSTDISYDACNFSQKYYQKYSLEVEPVCTSLFKGLNLHFQPQIIICNPPYIPTDPSEKQSQIKYLRKKIESVTQLKHTQRSYESNMIAYSYMGGPEGLDTTRLLITSIKWECLLYIIVMGEQGLDILRQEVLNGKIVNEKCRAEYQVLQKYKKMNEELYVVKIKFFKK